MQSVTKCYLVTTNVDERKGVGIIFFQGSLLEAVSLVVHGRSPPRGALVSQGHIDVEVDAVCLVEPHQAYRLLLSLLDETIWISDISKA